MNPASCAESKRMIVRAREKCLRAAADHLKQIALQNNIPQLIATRSSFPCKATELSSILPKELNDREGFNLFQSPPWLASSFCTNQVSSTIPGISGCGDPSALQLEKSLDHISLYQVDCTIYTDGSASAGLRNGAAAVIISTGSHTQPTVVSTIKIKGRAFTSSYDEKIAAMESALQWISTNANSVQTSILICTDSQPLCDALSSWNPRTISIRQCISSISSTIFMQGYQDTPPFLAITTQTEQQKKPPQLNQISSTLHQFHAPFRSSTNFSATILLLTPEQAKFTNIARLRSIYNNYKAAEMMY